MSDDKIIKFDEAKKARDFAQDYEDEVEKMAQLHAERAELEHEQIKFSLYYDFVKNRIELAALAGKYEADGDMLRAEAVRRSVPIAPELLDYQKRKYGKEFFKEVILKHQNIYEALLVYGPEWLEYHEEKMNNQPEE